MAEREGNNHIYIKLLVSEKDETLGIPFWIFQTNNDELNKLENEIENLIGLDMYNRIFDYIFEINPQGYTDQLLYIEEEERKANLLIYKTFDLTETFKYILDNPHLI